MVLLCLALAKALLMHIFPFQPHICRPHSGEWGWKMVFAHFMEEQMEGQRNLVGIFVPGVWQHFLECLLFTTAVEKGRANVSWRPRPLASFAQQVLGRQELGPASLNFSALFRLCEGWWMAGRVHGTSTLC